MTKAQTFDPPSRALAPPPALVTEYPHRPIRLCLECHGQLLSEGRPVPMVLRNISQGGARIETTVWLAIHQVVRLVIDGVPELLAQVRWRNRYDHGLAFDPAFCLHELAAHVRVLRPFPHQPSPAATEFMSQLLNS
jgi:hypothetical protein